MGVLTELEIEALQTSGLHKKSPFAIQGVSGSMFSVARYYGSTLVSGYRYEYFPAVDELIRDDVVRWLTKYRKSHAKKAAAEKAKEQQEITNL